MELVFKKEAGFRVIKEASKNIKPKYVYLPKIIIFEKYLKDHFHQAILIFGT